MTVRHSEIRAAVSSYRNESPAERAKRGLPVLDVHALTVLDRLMPNEKAGKINDAFEDAPRERWTMLLDWFVEIERTIREFKKDQEINKEWARLAVERVEAAESGLKFLTELPAVEAAERGVAAQSSAKAVEQRLATLAALFSAEGLAASLSDDEVLWLRDRVIYDRRPGEPILNEEQLRYLKTKIYYARRDAEELERRAATVERPTTASCTSAALGALKQGLRMTSGRKAKYETAKTVFAVILGLPEEEEPTEPMFRNAQTPTQRIRGEAFRPGRSGSQTRPKKPARSRAENKSERAG